MLAQRTDDHCQLFVEDQEAVFFNDLRELREKLAYWMHPDRSDARKRMATAARARCVNEDYSYVPVVRSYLKHFGLPVVTSA